MPSKDVFNIRKSTWGSEPSQNDPNSLYSFAYVSISQCAAPVVPKHWHEGANLLGREPKIAQSRTCVVHIEIKGRGRYMSRTSKDLFYLDESFAGASNELMQKFSRQILDKANQEVPTKLVMFPYKLSRMEVGLLIGNKHWSSSQLQ
jgi:hypothetical protein